MNAKIIGFWVVTGLFALALGAGGIADILLVDAMKEAMDGLGYPHYFAQIIGTWKVLGVAALLAPGMARVKEWAYAGFFFNLTGAFASHLLIGQSLGESLAPLVLVGLLAASYVLRPQARRMELPGFAGEPVMAK